MSEMRNPEMTVKMSRTVRQEMNTAYGNARKIAVRDRGKPRLQKTGPHVQYLEFSVKFISELS